MFFSLYCISSFWSISVHHICFPSLCVQFNPQAHPQLSSSCNSCTPFSCHISSLPRHATFCFFLFFSSLFTLLQWAIVASIWVKVVLLLTHTLQFLRELNAPTPLPCLHFPAPYPHCMLRSCPGTPTCSHLTPAFDHEGNEQQCPPRPTRNLPCHATDSYATICNCSTRWSISLPLEYTWETDGRYSTTPGGWPLASAATIRMAN